MSHKKSRITQLLDLVATLKLSAMSLEDISNYYASAGNPKSKRQIQRDLKEISEMNTSIDPLEHYYSQKTKYYYINTVKQPQGAALYFQTEFNCTLNKPKQRLLISKIEEAIQNNIILKIISINSDQTGDNFDFKDHSFLFIPLLLIEHRNSFYVGGYRKDKEEIAIFNLFQINQFIENGKQLDNTKYLLLLKNELNQRFGITKNINDAIYTIKIEIANVLIEYIRQYKWHESQKIIKENNRVYLIMQCGINRELLGWLFQWMYNIRIIEPPELIVYYTQALNKIKKNQENNNRLVYRNIFTKKSKK